MVGNAIRPAGRPASVDELMARARGLAGRTLGELAGRHGLEPPPDTRRDKGFVGELLELTLGATAGSTGRPDFPELGVELKSLPVDSAGRSRGSTWVCAVPRHGEFAATWEGAWVRHKLSRVLWVPWLAEGSAPLAERVVGQPLLWSPSAEEEAALRRDWEELTELYRIGREADVTAHLGRVLQMRPKGKSSRDVEWTLDADSEWVPAMPRGFYLRASFTRAILARHYAT